MAGPERFELPTAGFEDQNSSAELRTVINKSMYIQIKFVSKKSIYIKLFDNPATRKWFEKFSSCKFSTASMVNGMYNQRDNIDLDELPYVLSKINFNWNNIKLTLQKLKDIGFNTDLFDLPESFNFDQQLLNQLHRFFTYNILWYHKADNTNNPFDPNFKNKCMSRQDWHELLNQINESVHNLEQYTTTNNRNILKGYPLKFLQVILNSKPTNNSWIDFNLEEQQENYKYQIYKKKSKKPLVRLDPSILGKSYLQSFLDHDDPTCVDCTGRLGSHGNFYIDVDNTLSDIYMSEDFKEWLSHYNIINPPLEFPIGIVVKPHRVFLKSIIKSKVEDVIFFKTWHGN